MFTFKDLINYWTDNEDKTQQELIEEEIETLHKEINNG